MGGGGGKHMYWAQRVIVGVGGGKRMYWAQQLKLFIWAFTHLTQHDALQFCLGKYEFRSLCCSIWVKVKVKVKFNLEQATKAQRGSRCIDLLSNLGTKWGEWSMPRPDRFTSSKDPVPIV